MVVRMVGATRTPEFEGKRRQTRGEFPALGGRDTPEGRGLQLLVRQRICGGEKGRPWLVPDHGRRAVGGLRAVEGDEVGGPPAGLRY